jgi:hypothetical protein
MAYGAALFPSFQTQKRTAQEIEDTTWISIDAADSTLVDNMRMLLARQEQQKKNALGTFVSADEDSAVQWQTEILQNRVEDLETALAEDNTKIHPLHEERKEMRERMGALRTFEEHEGKLMGALHQGKLLSALRRLAKYEGDTSSSKRPRESSREPSRSWRDRSNSRERSRGRKGSRSPKVTYAGGSSSEGGGSSGSRGRDRSGGR